ncbi:hypothetical protein B0H14DRAFT_3488162 [Mycena olivaceomarginata]|nr:hypothetical protein B0H14DRAFT_3488162 [Mycena olivaceomarginata]
MVCDLPLVSHHNYKNDEDHDQNTHKYWFIVFGVGLFTAQKDALQAAGNKEDGVHVFITRNQATRAWARHCRRRHTTGCHKTRDPKAHPSDADSNTDSDTEPPHARAHRQLAAGAKRGQTTVEVKEEKKSVKPIRTVSTDRRHVLWPTNRPPKLCFLPPLCSASWDRPRDNMAGDNDDNHRHDNMAGDDNDRDPHDNDRDPNESDSPDAPPRKRRVVDVTVDDPDWEDEVEGTLPGLGTTTHRSCNPHLPVNPRHKMRRRVVASP